MKLREEEDASRAARGRSDRAKAAIVEDTMSFRGIGGEQGEGCSVATVLVNVNFQSEAIETVSVSLGSYALSFDSLVAGHASSVIVDAIVQRLPEFMRRVPLHIAFDTFRATHFPRLDSMAPTLHS